MKTFYIFLIIATALLAQEIRKIPIWTGGANYIYYNLGSSFLLKDGVLDVNFPVTPPQAKPRTYNKPLVADTLLKGWRLPTGATKVVVYTNGMRMDEGTEYKINSLTLIVPIPPYWLYCDVDRVRVDYE